VTESIVDVRELIAWGLDEYSFRTSAEGFHEATFLEKVRHAHDKLILRHAYTNSSALLDDTQHIQDLFDVVAQREDLHEEYNGLDWRLGVIDLRRLLAFQRRLVFQPARLTTPVPKQDDWSGLVAFTLGSRRNTRYRLGERRETEQGMKISLHSNNPDLQLRLTMESGCGDSLPLSLHGGCPFLEVAELRGRWLLRDGYHRAYCLLQAGVSLVPAVVLRTQTMEELGATESWFFNESQLFSDRPPHVMDFLDDEMTFCYKRAALRKVIRIRIEEKLEPFDNFDEVEREEL
jgi:hypothetical protein